MKIAHISDIHWRGIQRHKEYNEVFNTLFEKLIELKPDCIINTGDTYHTKTQGITPEIIDRLSWMFRSLANIAPLYTMLGNHDGNLTNLHRMDIITPIHQSVAHPNSHLLRQSGRYKIGESSGKEIALYVFSPFDKVNWDTLNPRAVDINIALYHGSVAGSEMDNSWRIPEEIAETEAGKFAKYDFGLFGDIHKQQFLAKRKDKKGILKPWMAYPGSLIQQNFGEDERKGFLIWDIVDKNDWNVRFHELQNRYPFVTINWEGSVSATIDKVKQERRDRAFLPGARFRISSSNALPSVESRKIRHELREKRKAAEVVFKYDRLNKMDHFSANSLKISKKGLRQDPDAVVKLYLEYVKAHATSYNFNLEHLHEAEKHVRNYMSKLMSRESDTIVKSQNWSIKSLEFDNTFKFGPDNKINFENLNGIVGVFGPNRQGKSSIVGTLMYGLYNTTDRGPIKTSHLINDKQKYCKVKVRLDVDGKEYVIERQSARVVPKRKNSKFDPNKTTTTLNFYQTGIDQETGEKYTDSKNSVSRDATDKEIRKLIGSAEDFLLTAVSSQAGIDQFLKEGPTNRKRILARFLELDIFDKLYSLAKEECSTLHSRSATLSPESIVVQIKDTRKAIENVEQEIKFLDEKLTKSSDQKDELKLWLMHHEKSAADVDLAHVNNLENKIKTISSSISQKQKELTSLKQENKKVQKQYNVIIEKKTKINVEKIKEQLESLEALKTTLQDLKHDLSTQKTILNNQEKNIKKLEIVPCGDHFPECHYIKDGHRDKKKIDSQRRLVEELSNKHLTIEEEVKNFLALKLKEAQEHYQMLDRKEFNLKHTSASHDKHINLLENEIKSLSCTHKKYKEELLKLKKKVNLIEGKEYERKKANLQKIQKNINELETKRQAAFVTLGGKKETLKNLILEEEETKTLIEKLKIFDSILDAFSKNGIPAMVLETQLPAINQELEKILEGIIDFKIELSTDVSSNVMDIHIIDENSSRIIELASGMERTLTSMALRVALINLSSLPKPDILIIDEGFGAFDENSVQSSMEMLTFLRSYFKTIIIISHVPAIKEVADKILEVKRDGAHSKIEE